MPRENGNQPTAATSTGAAAYRSWSTFCVWVNLNTNSLATTYVCAERPLSACVNDCDCDAGCILLLNVNTHTRVARNETSLPSIAFNTYEGV